MANRLRKSVTVVLVVMIVAASAAPSLRKKHSIAKKSAVRCPIPASVGKDDLLANPDDCTTYYHCVYGIPILRPCPSRLHFNPKMQYCDWPWKAGCDHSLDPKPPSTPNSNTCKARFRKARRDNKNKSM